MPLLYALLGDGWSLVFNHLDAFFHSGIARRQQKYGEDKGEL
jgi:hypothetical protein